MAQLTETDIELATKAYGAARAAVQDCYAQVHAYADAEENHPGHFEVDEYLKDMAAHLAELNRKAIDAVRILLELIGLNETQIDFDKQLAGIEEADFTKVIYFDEYIGAHNAVVDIVSRRLDRIGPLLEIPANVETERRMLGRMLHQIPHYLDSMKNVPTREKDVQDALHPALRLAFPDVIREPVIPKQTKTYKPDFGIDSIATAVEVKFADDKVKATSAIGQLYEDMKGYAASEFTLFIGLVYLTGAYLSQEQVEAELKRVGTPKDWCVAVVVGGGTTKSKSEPAGSAKSKTP